jgi:hypothetical protein
MVSSAGLCVWVSREIRRSHLDHFTPIHNEMQFICTEENTNAEL